MIFMIVIVTTMISLMVIVIILSLRRKLNWKPYVVIGTRESFFGWRPEGTAGKFLLGAPSWSNLEVMLLTGTVLAAIHLRH